MKRVISIILSAALALGLFTVAASAADPKGTYSLGMSGTAGTQKVYSLGEVRPDDTANFFIYINGQHALRQDIRNDKIDVKRKASEGARAVEAVSIKYDRNGYAYVCVEFAEPFQSTKELDFSVILYLTSSKTRLAESELEITGTLENHILYVQANEDYVNMADYPVVEAEGYVRSIRLDLGQGISIYAKLFEGRRYYAQANQDITSADEHIIDRYPAIDTIFYLQTINLNSAGNHVRFDLGNKLFVYNADLQYLGTTNDKLPYSTKYYLSTVELDVEDAREIDSIPTTSEPSNVPSGGDDVPVNVNRNPGTGR